MLADEFHVYAVLPLIFGLAAVVASYTNKYRVGRGMFPRFTKWERRTGVALLGLALVMWLGGLATGH